jgi:hypothetical protein
MFCFQFEVAPLPSGVTAAASQATTDGGGGGGDGQAPGGGETPGTGEAPGGGGGVQHPPGVGGRGFHSSTSQLNLSCFLTETTQHIRQTVLTLSGELDEC